MINYLVRRTKVDWFRHIQYKWLLAALIPGSIIFGPLPYFPVLYYGLLVFMAFIAVSKSKNTYILPLLFLLCCSGSIIIGNPPEYFKSWARLGLFLLLLFAVFPILSNAKVNNIRHLLLRYSIWLCSFIGVTGVFCFIFGINYMHNIFNSSIESSGIFGGFAKHSMMLGPCGAIGMITCCWLSFQVKRRKALNILCWVGVFLSLLSAMLSASRIASVGGIIGITTLLYIANKGKIMKLLAESIAIIALLIVSYPLYETYASPLINKQEKNEEAGSTFSSRENKWNNRIEEFKAHPVFGVGFASVDINNKTDYDLSTGALEPGSSYLGILSMTGICGSIVFIAIFYPILLKLFKSSLYSPISSEKILWTSLLMFFSVTMIAEGYVLAAGSYFCFLFWLLLGVSYTSIHNIHI